ncbi:unnamed protein product [Echinostoma caproni]|uniref:G_PROTEIN_RECEP_F1_2 domain-containing protein n=1 Tax=Echinostoma caproni TaxID=27848 RepID=A0A183B9E3_9TREM|nr:unnamed protein product [Echinostoma caproni]
MFFFLSAPNGTVNSPILTNWTTAVVPNVTDILQQNQTIIVSTRTPIHVATANPGGTVERTTPSSIPNWNISWFAPKPDGCSRTNRMACEEWQLVQQVEQHVFTSFVIIYLAAHAIFIFWLYFDASRRRREMRQKDRDYRVSCKFRCHFLI